MKSFMFLYACGVAILIGNLIFFIGYFPLKKSIPRSFPQKGESIFQLDPKCSDVNLMNESPLKDCDVKPLYDRLVFVVIDALRKDFILSSRQSKYLTKVDKVMTTFKKDNLKFINKLLKSKETITFTSHVRPPTVTLSGIKTLTTGTVSAFVDVILNFGSGALSDDNILERLRDKGKKMLFYGDETWLKLFPKIFLESEGTSSFFVSDYTEVDANVTRHLEKVVKRSDWDCLFLHYLGLDHIGHLSGPSSSIMGPKLREMDRMVEYLKLNVDKKDKEENRRTLIILTSDHGMTDDGNHGGSSDDELNTPLILVGSTFKHIKFLQRKDDEVNQVDIIPTISLLMGATIPSNNIGVVIPHAFMSAGVMETLKALYINGRQLFKVLKRNDDNFKENKFYKLFQKSSDRHLNLLRNTSSSSSASSQSSFDDEEEALGIISQYKQALDGLSEELVFSLSKYDLPSLWSAAIFNCLCSMALTLRLASPGNNPSGRPHWCMSMFLSLVCGGTYLVVSSADHSEGGGLLLMKVLMTMASVFAFSTELTKNVSQFGGMMSHVKKSVSNPGTVFIVVGIAMNCLAMLSSSFIEEEQNVHHFIVITFLIIAVVIVFSKETTTRRNNIHSHQCKLDFSNFLRHMVSTNHSAEKYRVDEKATVIIHSLMALLMCRIAKSWNQTGDKWKHLEDVGDWLNRPENYVVLLLVVIVSVISIFIVEFVGGKHGNFVWLFLVCGFASSLVHQLNSGPMSTYLFGSLKPNEDIRIITAQMSLGASITMFIVSMLKGLKMRLTKKNDKDDDDDDGDNDNIRVQLEMMTIMRLSVVIATLTLCRPHNCFLVLINCLSASFLHRIFRRSSLSPPIGLRATAVLYFWMGQIFFYYQGNSNNLTTIDFSVGNTGQRSYSFLLATCLTFVNTYSSVIFWLLSLIVEILSEKQADPNLSPGHDLCHLLNRHDDDDDDDNDDGCLNIPLEKLSRKSDIYEVCLTILATHSLTSTFYLLVMIMMRYHLFVWSVFSPKFLYVIVMQFLLTMFMMFCSVFL